MSPLYTGVGGVVRELTEMDTGINGVVTPLTEMWAGVGGVQRQIFSAIKIATWQKWDLKTTYSFYRRTSTNNKDVYTGGNVTYKYFSETLPDVTKQQFDVAPTQFAQIFPTMTFIGFSSIRVSSPVPNSGYYAAFDSVSSLILCRVFYMEQGESLTVDPENFRNYLFPSKRECYYPVKNTNYQKGSVLIETVTAPEGTYPDNGRSGDYWYVKI